MKSSSYREDFRKYFITVSLIAANCAVFLMLEIIGDTTSAGFMAEHGAVYPDLISEKGEYWRLFTAMFLHFGGRHLLNNMIMLGAAGNILEEAMGHVKFALLYLLAGIGGSTLSWLQMVQSGDYAVSAGASGAIFGIMGGLLWVVIRHKGRYARITGKGLLILIGLSLYYGISTGGVDNWGHIGGLLMGFAMSVLLYRKNR